MNKILEGGTHHELLSKLLSSQNVPIKLLATERKCRVQPTMDSEGKMYHEGFHFSAPTKALGRYNDPTGILPVCYLADSATLALAEVFGRRDAGNGQRAVQIDRKDFICRSISFVTPARPLRFLDLTKALISLGLTLADITSKDYSVTQMLVAYFADHQELNIDGIAYRSTHYADEYCYALWKKGDDVLLNTESIEELSSFKCDEVPEWLEQSDIDAEEILTQVLGFTIPSIMD